MSFALHSLFVLASVISDNYNRLVETVGWNVCLHAVICLQTGAVYHWLLTQGHYTRSQARLIWLTKGGIVCLNVLIRVHWELGWYFSRRGI